MVTFTINIPHMLAYIPYMDPMGPILPMNYMRNHGQRMSPIRERSQNLNVSHRQPGNGRSLQNQTSQLLKPWPSRNSGFTHWKWWFSIVIVRLLVCQPRIVIVIIYQERIDDAILNIAKMIWGCVKTYYCKVITRCLAEYTSINHPKPFEQCAKSLYHSI